jgi:hypothetical protein
MIINIPLLCFNVKQIRYNSKEKRDKFLIVEEKLLYKVRFITKPKDINISCF